MRGGRSVPLKDLRQPPFVNFKGSKSCALSRGLGGQRPQSLLTLVTRGQISEREEGAFGPDAEDFAAADIPGFGQRDELVIGCAVDARFDWESAFAITDMKIGRWFAGEQIVADSDGVLEPGRDALVSIGTKAKGLGGPVAGPVEFDGSERGVLNIDEATFGGGFEEVFTLFIAFEDGRKQTDHRFSGDGTAPIEPGPVAFDDEG